MIIPPDFLTPASDHVGMFLLLSLFHAQHEYIGIHSTLLSENTIPICKFSRTPSQSIVAVWVLNASICATVSAES